MPGADGWSRVQIKRNGKFLDADHCSDDVHLSDLSTAEGGACQLWRLVPVEGSGGWSRLQIKYTGGGGGGGVPSVEGGNEEYSFEGETYGWYDDGWNGAGWYIIGYEFRRGFGFGGHEGWHSWHHHGSHAHGGHHDEHHGGEHHDEHHGGEHHGGEHHEAEHHEAEHHGGGGGHHFGGGGHHGGGGGHHFGGGGGGHRGGGGGHRGGGGGGHGGGHGGGGHGGGHGGGGHGGGHHSDIRLKHDIVMLGRLDNGLGFYRFSYNGSDKAYVGVMAQEVQAVMPEAVVRGRDGYLLVYYERLGLRMQTWNEWVAAGRKIPTTGYSTLIAGNTGQGDYPVNTLRFVTPLAIAAVTLAIAPALAQTKPPASEAAEAASAPQQSSLIVGALQIGSVANLEVAGFDISMTARSVVYSYYLKNTGTAELLSPRPWRCPTCRPAPTAARLGCSPKTTRKISSTWPSARPARR